MPAAFRQIKKDEWTFNSWGLIVHVRGTDEMDYIRKHYDIFKEEMGNRNKWLKV